jgi:NAD(P)-dependent dehydrogenase (short-subunit alcohol dehydrogenase family)
MNLRGPFLMVKHAAPNMIARKYGKIINISSGTAYKGMPLMLHYVTSKGGILAFTRALSRELGVHSICVNTLAPGLIRTDGIHANSRPSRSDTGDTVRTAGRSFTRPSCAGRRIGERGERHPPLRGTPQARRGLSAPVAGRSTARTGHLYSSRAVGGHG